MMYELMEWFVGLLVWFRIETLVWCEVGLGIAFGV